MSEPRVLPCPFCGWEYPTVDSIPTYVAQRRMGHAHYVVQCLNRDCDAHGPVFLAEPRKGSFEKARTLAIEGWNRAKR